MADRASSKQSLKSLTHRRTSGRKPAQIYFNDVRKLSHENLISQLMNSNGYCVNLRLIVFTSSYFEMRDKMI